MDVWRSGTFLEKPQGGLSYASTQDKHSTVTSVRHRQSVSLQKAAPHLHATPSHIQVHHSLHVTSFIHLSTAPLARRLIFHVLPAASYPELLGRKFLTNLASWRFCTSAGRHYPYVDMCSWGSKIKFLWSMSRTLLLPHSVQKLHNLCVHTVTRQLMHPGYGFCF